MTETNNTILYQAKLHWVLFFWPFVWLCLSLYVANAYPILHIPAFTSAAVAVFWGLLVWCTYQFSSISVHPTRIILRSGLFVRQTVDMPLSKIETIDIRQSLLGSLLQFGTLTITGTGGTRKYIHSVYQPLTCRRHIEQLLLS